MCVHPSARQGLRARAGKWGRKWAREITQWQKPGSRLQHTHWVTSLAAVAATTAALRSTTAAAVTGSRKAAAGLAVLAATGAMAVYLG
jgi:hypothetical protein